MDRLACVSFSHLSCVGEGLDVAERERVMGLLRSVSPCVEPYGVDGRAFFLDARGLTGLYCNASRWTREVTGLLRGEGIAHHLVTGFSRFGTWAVATGCCALRGVGESTVRVFRSPGEEREAALGVRVEALIGEGRVLEAFGRLRVVTVGDFLRLPSEGLLLRYGEAVRELHAFATGGRETPLRGSYGVEPIAVALEFEPAENDTNRMLFRLKPVVERVVLRAAQGGEAVAGVSLEFVFERKGRSQEKVGVARPTLDVVVIVDLVRLRLEAMTFEAAVSALTLTVETVRADSEQMRLWLNGRPKRDVDAALRALARLRATYGDEAVVRAELVDRHLPHGSYRWVKVAGVSDVGVSGGSREEGGGEVGFGEGGRGDGGRMSSGVLVRRFYESPRRFAEPRRDHGDHAVVMGQGDDTVGQVHGPYRITGGWWRAQGGCERDDYFIETTRGEVLWVYLDRLTRRWFLQGRVE